MSCYEWERGKIKLPTAEFAKVRQAMQDWDQARKQRIFDASQRFWKGLTPKQKRDSEAYRKAVHDFCYGDRSYNPASGTWNDKPGGIGRHDEDLAEEVSHLLEQAEYDEVPDERWGGTKRERRASPRRVLKSDIDWPTNRTTAFQIDPPYGEVYVDFDRDSSTVTWGVAENNHAVETAHALPGTAAFNAALNKVRWTRGTGGVIVGNNEYNRDSEYEGGGGNYVAWAVGPVGMKQAEYACRPFIDSQGKRWPPPSPSVYGNHGGYLANGGQSRVARGVPTGGQFTGRRRGEANL